MRHLTRFSFLTLALSLTACGGTSSTGGSGQMNPGSLVGMRGSSMDMELRGSGFETKGGYKTDDASITMWWNPATRQCLSVTTRDGKVASAENIFEGNCL